ncbi:hypothetical protein LOZ66_001363 [Ophidiomyces ophidiicola]|nr:hypothetical protein LOZ66_001363 [Ophidiomyces ophidiicola]
MAATKYTGQGSPDVRSKYIPTDEHIFRSPYGPFPKVDENLNVHDFLFPQDVPLGADYDLFIDANNGNKVTMMRDRYHARIKAELVRTKL